jgi:hypothetical protein
MNVLIRLDETARTVGFIEFDAAHLETFFCSSSVDIGD